MKKKVLWRLSIIGLTMLIAVIFFLPNTPLFKYMPSWWQKNMPNKGIILGLDLQGGIHLVYEVEWDKAVDASLDSYVFMIRETLSDKKLQAKVSRNGDKIEISPATAEISSIIEKNYPVIEEVSSEDRLVLKNHGR